MSRDGDYSDSDGGNEYCDEHVCVCLFVLDHIFGITLPSFTKFLLMLPRPWLDPPLAA